MVIKNCRLCGDDNLDIVVRLGHHPLADTFLTEEFSFEPETSYPLELGLCGSCGHVSTIISVPPEDRYQKQNYSYDSSNSLVSIEHFSDFSNSIISLNVLQQNDLILDIGSNVGTLLSNFKMKGYSNILGVEPSYNIANIANSSGIRTLNDFFCERIIPSVKEIGDVKVLLSSNVINHVDDIDNLLITAKKIMSPDGIFVFEVPYLLDLVKKCAFDTIYHEHVHYFGIKPLSKIFSKHGFSISKIERIDYMCGSIRVYANLSGKEGLDIFSFIREEVEYGLYHKKTYNSFMSKILKIKQDVNLNLWQVKSRGGKIIGIGAATKGNTFLNYCGIDSDLIDFITDSSLLKIGKYTPGSKIKIKSDDDIDSSITHALILPWNISDMLKMKLSHLGLIFYEPILDSTIKEKRII